MGVQGIRVSSELGSELGDNNCRSYGIMISREKEVSYV